MSSNPSAFDTVCAARMGVYRKLPYFMKMLFKLTPVEHPGAGTFFVDEKLRVHFDPALALEWGVDYCATFLAHEVQHPLREHLRRGNEFIAREGARYHALRPWLMQIHPLLGNGVAFMWNIVADLEINPGIIEVGFVFPPKFTPLFPKTFALKDGQFAKEDADELFRRAEHRMRVDRDEEKARPPQMMPQGTKEEDDDEQDAEAGEADDDGQADGSGVQPADDSQDASDSPVDEVPAEGAPADGSDDGGGDAREEAPRPFEGMCGGCSGHKHELEDDIDEADMPSGATDAATDVARRQVAHDTLEPTEEMKRVMQQHGKGTVPGAFEQWAKAQLAPGVVPWQRVLAPLVRNAVAYVRGRIEAKYGRPSRRRIAVEQVFGDEAPILPGTAAPMPKVGVVLDASGSMQGRGSSGRAMFDEALSEVGAVVLATGSPCWAAAVDMTVQTWVRVKDKRDLQKLMKGGGGTDMRVGIRAAEERKFDVIVLVTDGYTPWPAPHEMPRRARLVTCIVGDASAPAHIRPVVRCNQLKKEAV